MNLAQYAGATQEAPQELQTAEDLLQEAEKTWRLQQPLSEVDMSARKATKKELEEASEVSGATWPRTFSRVILPLLAPGFVAGWVFVVTHSFRELATSIMLYRSGTEVISVVLFELWETGQYPQLSALGMILVGILRVISLMARAIGGKFSIQQV